MEMHWGKQKVEVMGWTMVGLMVPWKACCQVGLKGEKKVGLTACLMGKNSVDYSGKGLACSKVGLTVVR